MTDTARPQEEQGLEKGMGEEVEHADRHARLGDFYTEVALFRQSHADYSQTQHHVAQLTDGGIRQHALDIVGRQPHRGGENSRKAADNGDESDCLSRANEER